MNRSWWVGPARFESLLRVTVLEIKNGCVRLGFEADASIPVHRSEVWERIRESTCAGRIARKRRDGMNRPRRACVSHLEAIKQCRD